MEQPNHVFDTFGAEATRSGRQEIRNEDAFPTYVDRCLYFEGTHYPGVNCPHDAPSNELGEVIPEGWTVQSM